MKMTTILGAGPSGLVTAINLAKEGYNVDVYEKNKDVGMRFHGDLQGLENWSEKRDVLEELKEMNIVTNFDCDPFSKMSLTTCSKTRDIDSRRPIFYLVKRGSFSGTIDNGLKKQALKLGVNIHFQKTLCPSEADIVATGPNPKEVVGFVKGITFRTNIKDTAIVALDDKLAFKGYSYLLVTKRYGCMCTVIRQDEVNRINEYFEKTKEFFVEKFNLETSSIKEVGGFGSFSLGNYRKGNTLYIGESAGLQDFLWGFGIRFAFKSGYLAAQSVIGNKDYEEIAKKYFVTKLKAGVANRYLLENFLSKRNYSILIDIVKILNNNFYAIHKLSLLLRLIYPFALVDLKKTYPELKL